KEINIKEGDVVEAGQVLLSLDDTRFSSSLRENQLKYLALKAKAARLQAEAEGVEFVAPIDVLEEQPGLVEKEIKLYQSRRQQHERNMELVVKELNMTRPLVAQGAISEVEVLRLERQVNELEGQFRNEARAEANDANSEIKRLFESNLALQDRVTRTKVRSSVKGIVKQLMVNTVGGIIQPGMDIVEVVPLEDSLRVQAQIRPSDIAFLHPEQDAIVKFTAYDYAIYGGLNAKVEHISADTIKDENGDSFYLVRIRTEKNYLGTDKQPLPIIPGMMANVDILTGKKSVLSYLLKPVLRAKELAMTER
ncbi:MAG: HlyD family type I secretion periplasmic adaptor subunit, partial [Gammaproteobacteria bacterium]|nr:HlyD family type I secretion periplasmic adaptor subunit [Gammaproteobacteria bacterium]